MKYTEELKLPIYDNPEKDLFKIQEWNNGNLNIENGIKKVNKKLDDISINILNYIDFVTNNDWTVAFEKAFLNNPCTVFVPKGTYNIKYIKIPSNCTLKGDGINNTFFNAIADITTNNIITNIDYSIGNSFITIKDFTVKGNKLNQTPPNGFGSGVTFANCKNCICENVRVENPSLHCFDVMANKPYQLLNPNYDNSGYSVSKRSNSIKFINCEGIGAGDDTFTCHYSDYVYIDNCKAYPNTPSSSGSDNRNSYEVDDGCKNIYISNCYATGSGRGYEVKGHEHSPAPENVNITNCIAEKCVIGYQVRHLMHHLSTEPTSNGKNVLISGCKCINPVNIAGYEQIYPIPIQISGYNGVTVDNFEAIGGEDNCVGNALIGVQYKARNIILSNVVLRDFVGAKNGIYVVGGSNFADIVMMNNISIINSALECISIGSSITSVKISNANLNPATSVGSYGITSVVKEIDVNNVTVVGSAVNFRIAGKINDIFSKNNVLWSGNACAGGTVLTLNGFIKDYDYLIFDIYSVGTETRVVDFKNQNTFYIKSFNLSDSIDSITCELVEMRLLKTSESTITLEFNHTQRIDTTPMTKTKDNAGFYISKITGVCFK